jgi:hypothetical protein
MLKCERCGTSFSEMRSGRLASCPRCRVREGVAAPLVGRKPEGRAAPPAESVDRPRRSSRHDGLPV